MDTNVAGDTGKDAGGGKDATGGAGGSSRSVPLDMLPDPALLIDAQGAVDAANAAARGLFGRDPTGDALAGLLDQAALPAPEQAQVRLRVQGRHGDLVPFIADVSVSMADGTTGRRLVILRELATEPLLDESRRLLDLAFEHAPIGMAFFNPEGEYIRVNPALARMLDRAPEALFGRRVARPVPGHHRAQVARGQAAPACRRGPAHGRAQTGAASRRASASRSSSPNATGSRGRCR